MTAQEFLAATTISVKERFDGPYETVFTTNLGNGKNTTWGLNATTLNGNGALPSLSISSSCNPIPTIPDPAATDQNPLFDPRGSYTCTVTATPLSGADQRAQSKDFSFTTGPGQLIVMPPTAMNTLLADGDNNGGFVFKNQDTNPVTITALTLTISDIAMNPNDANGPFTLEFLDPVSGSVLAKYPLENLPADPGVPYTSEVTNVSIPLSFTVPAENQKMLPG